MFSLEGIAKYVVEGRNLPDINIVAQIIQGVPDDLDYMYGKSFLYLLGNLIPRQSEGSEKEILGLDLQLKELWFQGRPGGGRPPTLMGEFYINFGSAGVMVGMLLFGIFCGYLYKLLKWRENVWGILVYAAFIAKFVMPVIKGQFSATMQATFWHTVPVLMTLGFVKLLSDTIRSASYEPIYKIQF
jgi:oligosaccharide repeat unit polymerase